MSLLALVGDGATTTALALAAGWSAADDVVVVEVDRSGGSLAAWLDVPLAPSLSTVVTTLRAADGHAGAAGAWPAVETLVRRAPSGTRFVPAPFRAREASTAVTEAERHLVPLVARRTDVVALADVGRPPSIDHAAGVVEHADVVVVCHRQDPSSGRAAAVRLERVAEQVEGLRAPRRPLLLALIGDDPFSGDEIARFVGGDLRWRALAPDPLAAAVLAGRSGVSARRLSRLPLMRSARRLADDLRAIVPSAARPDVPA